MVKAADNRLAKYTAKFDPTVLGARATAIKSFAQTEFGVQASVFAELESRIKALIENDVPSPTLMPFYLAAARELTSKSQKYGGQVLYNEAQIVMVKWAARGLDSAILADIAKACAIGVTLYGS